MPIVFDVRDPKRPEMVKTFPSGIIGSLSMRRLLEQLREAKEFHKGERVTHVEIDEVGSFRFRVEVIHAAD